MRAEFETETRDLFITFGRVLAQTLREHDPDKQWIISLEDDAKSGKSVLALAADQQQNPARYPNGLTSDVSVKVLMMSSTDRTNVFFDDGFSTFDEHRRVAHWQEFIAANPQIKLSYLSNVWGWARMRSEPDSPSLIDGQERTLIDMRIGVEVCDGAEFHRRIRIKCDDNALLKKIEANFEAAIALEYPAKAGARAQPAAKRNPQAG